MIRAVVWKEFREQGLIALTLLVLGGGILVAAATLADPPAPGASPADVIRFLGAGRLATLLLAVTAGMVCGGALFAAEREAGTIGFLESLPASRWGLWRAKLAAGSALAAVQIVGVVGVSAVLGLVPTVGWALAVVVYALLAFAWGVFGSTLARTTLGSVGVAIPFAALCSFVFLFPLLIVFQHPGAVVPVRPIGGLIFLGLMLLTPVVGSAVVFTRPDRDRAADDLSASRWAAPPPRRPAGGPGPDDAEPAAGPAPRPARARLGLRALAWLAWRQVRGPGLILSAFAVLFGLMMLAPAAQPFLFWPPLALAAGVLAGVTVFADEQSSGSGRFWGERRLPVGRAWGVKVAAHAGLALWLVFLLALPMVVRSQVTAPHGFTRGHVFLSAVFATYLFDDLLAQGWKYVFAPVAYGFAAGHLCGLLFRKLVVAAGVAGLVGGTAAALWVPSLLAGGLSHWPLWAPPAVALVTARLLVRPWAADRLTARGPLATLAGGVGAAFLVQAAGIGYRVAGVPDDPAGGADVAYLASLPPIEENVAGRDFRAAAERFDQVGRHVADSLERRTGKRSVRPDGRLEDRALRVPLQGWAETGAKDPDVAAWLDDVFAGDQPKAPEDRPWFELAAAAERRQGGMYEDPRLVTLSGGPGLRNPERMGLVLVGRGLQLQAGGDPAPFAAHLRTALALARTLRNGSTLEALRAGYGVERAALAGTDWWLRGLAGRPDLLRAALDAVAATDTPAPFDPTPHLLAERHVLRERVKAPSQWLPDFLTPPGGNKDAANPEADLVAFAWTVPWERERTRRLVGLGFEAGTRQAYFPLLYGRPGYGFFVYRNITPDDLVEFDRQIRVLRRAVRLAVAVRLHQAEHGRTPASADELVRAGYLPAAPADPYDGRPFRYRVSPGETLRPPPRQPGERLPGRDIGPRPADDGRPVTVAAGQVIVWSVGPNGTDEGGKSLPMLPLGLGRQDDLMLPVPLPPAGG